MRPLAFELNWQSCEKLGNRDLDCCRLDICHGGYHPPLPISCGMKPGPIFFGGQSAP
jgi:hypothetical protein